MGDGRGLADQAKLAGREGQGAESEPKRAGGGERVSSKRGVGRSVRGYVASGSAIGSIR